MNLILSVDEQVVERARLRAGTMGKSLDFSDSALHGIDQETLKWITELRALSGRGNSNGRKFDRDEIHER